MKFKLKSILLMVPLTAISVSVMAQDPPPRDVRDLVGVRASSGESELEDRGYEFRNSSKSDSRIYSNWMNRRTDTCISVVTSDGRYEMIHTVPAFDCGRPGGSGGSDKVGSKYGDKWYDEYIGGRPGSAESEFERRGYTNVDGYKEGYESYTWWWQNENRRCFKMTVADGRVKNIRADRGACR